MNEATASANQDGYEIQNTSLAINKAGTYMLSGSCADGSVTVKKGVTGVTLVLNGLTLASADTAPITCNKSSRVTVVAAAGTTNVLTDAAYNNDDVFPDNTNAENAVIKCKDGTQVTIGGTGTLNINANGKNGIKSGATTETEGEAWLTIQDLTLNITAGVNDGVNAEQLLNITGGNITIDAADDAIHCDYTMNIGALSTNGPTINVTNCNEGLEAATLNINSGNITVHAADDCLNAANSDLNDYAFALNINGGTLTLDTTAGDGIDSNGSLTVSGGTVIVWSASRSDNQPLDADGALTITGGTVLAAGGSAGMGVRINAGQAYVTFGGSSTGGRINDMTSGMINDTMHDRNNGRINDRPNDKTRGDRNLPDTPPNGRIGGQAQPDMQPSTVNITKGSSFTIRDSAGKTLYSGTAICDAGYIFYSAAGLTTDSTYALYAGNESVASAAAQSGSGNTGGMGWRPDMQPDQKPAVPGEPFGEFNRQPSDQRPDHRFADVAANAWYAAAVQYTADKGLMNGSDNLFSPNGTTTRAEVITILARYAGVDTTGSGVWYDKSMAWSVAQNISDGSEPNEHITREQLVTMLWRYVGEPTADIALSGFSDADDVSSWAISAMSWGVNVGLITGDNGHLNPAGNANRAETAAIFMRFCEYTAK